MTNRDRRKAALELIAQNIVEHGFHSYAVMGGGDPRYEYTIGLSRSHGAELLFAGSYFYNLEDLAKIASQIVSATNILPRKEGAMDLAPWGAFSFRKVHSGTAVTLLKASSLPVNTEAQLSKS